ncbi:TetR/AcrR family transcriptional regulator [Streptomyces hoynatensis]|uniref:TetR/AcrR family transcriptional regulator n=1 Tax=Streptomyces hoynatensis TaxID=1141874 RepID=A0A3A9YFH0_9ACTN|nr:TetR/AcrR family transcriptional regulator [Streptomyces hoynatensis]RKN35871.1 TetR/AcrR family transcriptional regulator [Streptomyces hoynatensis]
MARPRTFDEDRALDAAMRVFWANGYEGTSTQNLCDATGLGRSSIYNTFASKYDLFSRALARYMETMTARQAAILEDTGRPAAERLRELFAVIVADEMTTRQGGHSLGCLTVNTTVELAAHDPGIARMLERDTARRLSLLREVVAAGRREGAFTSPRDPDDLARYLNALIAGLRISAQGGAGRAALEAITEIALDALTR